MPDFLGIGVQKGGTTWLYENLRCHPEIFIPPGKELHYFDRHAEAPLAEYMRRFRGAGKRRKGELTPAYGILPSERIRKIEQMIPELRLILVLRDPVERAFSQAVMELADRQDRAVRDVPIHDWIAFVESKACIARSQYISMLEKWLRYFPPEQLFVCFSEDLRRRPKVTLKSLFGFLGVSTTVDWSQFPLRSYIVPNVRHLTKKNFGLVIPARSRRRPLESCPNVVHARLEELFGPERHAMSRVFTRSGVPWLTPDTSFGTKLSPRLTRLKRKVDRVAGPTRSPRLSVSRTYPRVAPRARRPGQWAPRRYFPDSSRKQPCRD